MVGHNRARAHIDNNSDVVVKNLPRVFEDPICKAIIRCVRFSQSTWTQFRNFKFCWEQYVLADKKHWVKTDSR